MSRVLIDTSRSVGSLPTRTCFLHGGGRKTGTTALQSFLFQYRDDLLAKGYLVPRAGQSRSGAHHRLVSSLAEPHASALFEAALNELREEVANSSCDHMIITSERLEGLFGGHTTKIVESLSDLGFATKVVHYVRNTPQLFNSRYVQRVRTYKSDNQFDEYVAQALKSLRPNVGILEVIKKQNIPYDIRPYTATVRRRGIVEDFLSAIGLPGLSEGKPTERVNTSIGPVGIEAARISMKEIKDAIADLSGAQREQCRRVLKKSISKVDLSEPGYCGLTTETADAIQNLARESNDAFAQTAWGKTWEEVFHEEIHNSFTNNDLVSVEPTTQQREALDAVLQILLPRIRRIAKGRDVIGKRRRTRKRESARLDG